MEAAGFTSGVIAKSFNVSRENLILTMQYAKEYGFVYFSYQGVLIDHMDTLRAIGAKRYSFGVYEKFKSLTGIDMPNHVFSRLLGRVRPYL